MNLKRVSLGEKIAGLSAVLLFVDMFFDWFGVTQKDHTNLLYLFVPFPEPGKNAWQALDYIPIVLLLSIVAALTLPALSMKATRKPSKASYLSVSLLGIVSAFLILYRIVDPPSFGSYFDGTAGTVTREGAVQFPTFVALACAAGIAGGGLIAFFEIRHGLRAATSSFLSGQTLINRPGEGA